MSKPLVFQSDFGYVDGAVSAMYGVAYGVDPKLLVCPKLQVEDGVLTWKDILLFLYSKTRAKKGSLTKE